MEETLLVGTGKAIMQVSAAPWTAQLDDVSGRMASRLAFMTPEHRLLREIAVRELPRNNGQPLTLGDLARKSSLPLPGVAALVKDLERNLFFLVRNSAGDISWAFPVTSEKTPHRLIFGSGERTFAA